MAMLRFGYFSFSVSHRCAWRLPISLRPVYAVCLVCRPHVQRRQIDGNLMPDTVHPSVNGYKVLADCVSRVVRPLALGDTRKISLRGLR